MGDYTRALLDKLHQNGYEFLRHGKGDHDIWHNSDSGKTIAVDGKIRVRHLANKILKEAGINDQFR
jgi:predicted RNA binding protein YcfA (HicA-like mRNA interferase family)